MGYASRSGRAITNPEAPRAFAVCDHCGIWDNRHKLVYESEWQGTKLVNLRFLVHPDCRDRPNPQLKARMTPPDPTPVYDPRPETYIGEYSTTTIAQQFAQPLFSGRPPLVDPPTNPISGIPGPLAGGPTTPGAPQPMDIPP
jgi:hypothetical protein